MITARPASATKPEDMAKSRAWTAFLSGAAELPISFELDGKAIRGIPASWNPLCSRRPIDALLSETVYEGTEPGSGLRLRVECLEYRDFPVVEWMAWLANTGSRPTPIIRDIRVLDGTFAGSSPSLYHCNGDFYSEKGYTPEVTPLRAGETVAFAPNGGRPSDGAFPYYRLLFPDCGLTLAVGWPGQWAASFRAGPEGVHVQVGQEKTNLRLLPGERIRTPRVTILSWSGDAERAVNLWRRWYLAHILPRPDGRPLRPLLVGVGTEEGEEFTAATTENQLRFIERFKERGIDFDLWWIDAGWYTCWNKEHVRKWWETGTWEPDPERFPQGLGAISASAAKAGADLLVWFEPERVRPGTRLDVEHPEWLLRVKGTDDRLLFLGNTSCREWLTEHLCGLIRDNGIRIYRQDHNFPPLEHWRENDAEDRQGVNENLHVQGYLELWDELLRRNPGLWIDSCAGGGRRNDLETLRRSVPLHYTDYGYGEHPVKLAFHRTVYEWFPYFKECTLSWDLSGQARFDARVDSFSYHCGMAPMLFPTWDIRRDDYDWETGRKMIAIWRRAGRLFLHGDYYQHTPLPHGAGGWVAWQFDRPEEGNGMLQGIRLAASEDESITVHPRGIRAEAEYQLENDETGEKRHMRGEELVGRGFTFTLPARSGAIWFYSVVSEGGRPQARSR